MSRHLDNAPPLEDILRRHKKGDRIHLHRLDDGSWQASANRGRDISVWTCHTDPDPIKALLGALSPDWSGSWEKHLAPAPEDETEDDWSHLI